MATITNISSWGVPGRKLLDYGIDVDTLVVYPVGTGGVAQKFAQQLNGGPPDWLTAAYTGATVTGIESSDNGPEPPPLPPSPR